MALTYSARIWVERMNAIRLFRHTQRNVATFRLYDLANVQDIHTSATAAAFAGCNLSLITPQIRGHILEDLGRTIYERHHLSSRITDPIPGYRCNGSRRSSNQAEFDWMCDKTRVQCKSGQLSRSNPSSAWRCDFVNIKADMYDELFLVLYTPKKLHFICHNGYTGLIPQGSRTSSKGYRLRYSAPASIRCPQQAKSWVLQQMRQQACTILDSLGTSCQLVVQKINSAMHTPKQQLQRSAFQQHPLGDLNPTKRGLIVQHIVQKIDESHHNIATSFESGISHFDWRRKDLRIECKHTRIAWCSSHHSWVCRFSGVKMDRFDLLYLALDSPTGIHVFIFHGSKYLTSTGMCEECDGKHIRIWGPRNEMSWSVALDEIAKKLTSAGSEHIATVIW